VRRPTWTGTATPVSRPGSQARKIFVRRWGHTRPDRPFDEFDQRTSEGILVAAIAYRQPAQADQIGSHSRPEFKANDRLTQPAALSGTAHADGGRRRCSHL
jgi:hypothetical protein